MTMRILSKFSKRYEGQFLYWWDITPGRVARLNQYDLIEFVKKDTGECCSISPAEIVGFFTKDRHTSRSHGGWGIKVLRNRESELAFEPGNKGVDWLYLPIKWK